MAPPKALPAILAVSLPLFFSLGLAPLLAGVSNPSDNVHRLEVWVADHDGGAVGAALTAAFAGAAASGAPLPGFVLKPAADASPAALRSAVVAGDAWAAVWATPGATGRMAAALNASTGAAAAYDPAAAVTFVYDEARNNVAAARVVGSVRAVLAAFVARVTITTIAGTLAGAGAGAGAALAATAASRPDLLVAPVRVTEVSVAPFDVPVVATAQLLGNILCMVFGMAIANAIVGPLTPFVKKLRTPAARAGARAGGVVVYSMTVSAAFATILVGLANTHATGGEAVYTGDGATWATLWALFWLQLCIFGFFFLAVGVTLGPAAVPPFLLPVLLWNVLSASTDLADPGYAFFLYAPVFHSSIVLKAVLFGSLPGLVPRSVGILWLWLFVDVGAFLGASAVAERRAAAAAAAAGGDGAGAGGKPLTAHPPTHLEAAEVVVESAAAAAVHAAGVVSVGAAGGAAGAAAFTGAK
jgi:hypothetical protein